MSSTYKIVPEPSPFILSGIGSAQIERWMAASLQRLRAATSLPVDRLTVASAYLRDTYCVAWTGHACGGETPLCMSLGDVKQQLMDWFADNPGERAAAKRAEAALLIQDAEALEAVARVQQAQL